MHRVGGHSVEHRRAGMSLVEILVVLAIVGVMAAVVTLGVGLGDRGRGVETEANRLADRLRLASEDVLVSRRALSLRFGPDGYGFVRADGSSDGVIDALADIHRLPGGIQLASAGVDSPLTIDPDGAQPVAVFDLVQGQRHWRVTFDGLNAVASAGTEAAA